MIRVVFNPTARGDKARQVRELLSHLATSGGTPVVLHPTTGPGTAPDIAREAVNSGCSILVAAGGDGTVNEVVNGLATARDGLASTSLGILPLGTVNVFAKELGIPSDLGAAWNVLSGSGRRTLDLPFVQPVAPTGEKAPPRRYFAQMAGAGLDSLALRMVRWELKKRIGQFAYLWACVEALWAPRPQIHLRTSSLSLVAPLVAVGNGRFYGGRFPVFPKAQLDDGQLDVTVLRRATLLSLSRVIIALQRDRLATGPDALCLQTDSLTLDASDGTPWHVEGDPMGSMPISIGLLPKALMVVVP